MPPSYSLDQWDYQFHGISRAEAETMDPQQRLVLDCSHMAMEDGGFTRSGLNGTNTGVYIGKRLILKGTDTTRVSRY